MKDSMIYQEISLETRVDVALMLGKSKWGQPSEGEKVALEAINDIDRLDRMIIRINETKS